MLVIAVDGLRASALGAYGNTWFPTPHLDQLAAESFLAEWCYASALDEKLIYRSLWYGAHPLRTPQCCTSRCSLPARFDQLGYDTTLISDDKGLLQLAGAADFRFQQLVEFESPTAAADTASSTHLARLFSTLGEAASQRGMDTSVESPQLFWLHTRGMYGPWDVPLAWREALAEEGDPDPYAGTNSPDVSCNHEEQPDLPFSYACAYAALVQLLDTCCGAFLESLADDDCSLYEHSDGLLICLLGLRGFPLGEHGQIGGCDGRLFTEQMHVPLLIRMPHGEGRLTRFGGLFDHADVHATLLDSAAGPNEKTHLADGLSALPVIHGAPASWRDHVLSVGSGSMQAVRTPSWSMHWQAEQAGQATTSTDMAASRLFVRPDDRLEFNDIAQLRGDVLEGLAQACRQFAVLCDQASPLRPPSLPARLTGPAE